MEEMLLKQFRKKHGGYGIQCNTIEEHHKLTKILNDADITDRFGGSYKIVPESFLPILYSSDGYMYDMKGDSCYDYKIYQCEKVFKNSYEVELI